MNHFDRLKCLVRLPARNHDTRQFGQQIGIKPIDLLIGHKDNMLIAQQRVNQLFGGSKIEPTAISNGKIRAHTKKC